jgi:hypothetical protein
MPLSQEAAAIVQRVDAASLTKDFFGAAESRESAVRRVGVAIEAFFE